MSKREEQKEKRRIQILLAALDLFVEKGYGATRTSDIAKAVQMSDGLLFHYYPSKESLYLALVENGLRGTTEPFENTDVLPLDFFSQIVTDFLEKVRINRATAKIFVLMEQAQKKNAVTESIHAVASKVNMIPHSIPMIEAGQKQGTIRPGNPLALSYAFWGALQGIMQELAVDEEVPVPEAEWLIDIIKNPNQR